MQVSPKSYRTLVESHVGFAGIPSFVSPVNFYLVSC
jgi:hypothetical protein